MSPTFIKPSTIRRAKTLRKAMTNGEQRLWSELRDFRRHYGVHVRKQAPIGPYIADFCIHSAKLVVEVDGEFHHTSDGLLRDTKRDAWLDAQGYRTLRFTTGDLETSFDGCVEEILRALGLMEQAVEPVAYPHP